MVIELMTFIGLVIFGVFALVFFLDQ